MGMLHLDPVLFRLTDLLVDFVGNGAGLVLHHVAEVDLIPKNGLDRHIVPVGRLAPQVRPALRHVVEAAGRGYALLIQRPGDFPKAVPLQAHIEDAENDRSSHRVDFKDVLVRRGFSVADGSVAANILSALEGGLFHCPDFAAGISCVEVVHDIFQNDQHLIVFVNGVHTVIESDEPAAHRREHDVTDMDKTTKPMRSC